MTYYIKDVFRILLSPYLEIIKNKSYVQTSKGDVSLNTGNAKLVKLFDPVNIKAKKKIDIHIYIPTRCDSTSWGGAYFNVNIKVNGAWYNLGNTGYDGGVMAYSAKSINAHNHKLLFDPSWVGVDTEYTVEVEVLGRSNNGTTYVNFGHDINKTSKDLGKRGGLLTQVSDQNYMTLTIEEKD